MSYLGRKLLNEIVNCLYTMLWKELAGDPTFALWGDAALTKVDIFNAWYV